MSLFFVYNFDFSIFSQNFELDPKFSSKKDEPSDDESDSEKNKTGKENS